LLAEDRLEAYRGSEVFLKASQRALGLKSSSSELPQSTHRLQRLHGHSQMQKATMEDPRGGFLF
jgi:hypothetical protein